MSRAAIPGYLVPALFRPCTTRRSAWKKRGAVRGSCDSGWTDEAAPAAAGDVRLLRVLKIREVRGGHRGPARGARCQPEEGCLHTWADVEKELSDVIVTAMVALATISPDAEKLLDDRLQHLVERVDAG